MTSQPASEQRDGPWSPLAPTSSRTVAELLASAGYQFEFHQAVWLLEQIYPHRRAVGYEGPRVREVTRFRTQIGLSFPASAVHAITLPPDTAQQAEMIVAFMGLTGPSGVLPRHYSELVLRLDQELDREKKEAFREWLDLFNHRLISLFHRAWEKYRFQIPYARGEATQASPDPFTRSLLSLVGLGLSSLRERFRVSTWGDDLARSEEVVTRVADLNLLRYTGFLSHRLRPAISLQAFLQDYFQLPVEVHEFQGRWLTLETLSQTRLGGMEQNNRLGLNAVVGEQVWDIQGKIRVRLGPLTYQQLEELLPDQAPSPRRKVFFQLSHLVRLFVGPTLDIEVQLVLRVEEVPDWSIGFSSEDGPRLGWNTWLPDLTSASDRDDAVFYTFEVRWLTGDEVEVTREEPSSSRLGLDQT